MDIEYRGRIHTLAGPSQTSLVVSEGRIVHVGDPVHGVSRTVRDLEGAVLLPAFVDSHCHPMGLGMRRRTLAIADPAVRSLADLLRAVQKRHRELPDGAWVTGQGYDEAKWPIKRVPTRAELDEAAPGRSVYLTRSCGHHAVASTSAFQAAGLWRSERNLPGIDRDHAGLPTGGIHEMAALSAMSQAVPIPDDTERVQACEEASRYLAALGIVHASDLCAGLEAYSEWETYLEAERSGRLQIGIDLFVEATPALANGLPDLPVRRKAQSGRQPLPLVTLSGVKCLADGSISGRTAALSEPFRSESASGQDRGLLTTDRDTLLAAFSLCHRQRLQLAVHAMGDRAIDFVLDILPPDPERLAMGQPAITLEHASMPTPEAIRRMARRAIGVSTQPIFPYAEIESYMANLGPERTQQTYPLRSLLAGGVELALSSDAPSTASDDPANPWLGIALATERRAAQGFVLAPDQRIGLTEALTLYSAGGSDLRGLGHRGRLAVGYRADFAIWALDPFEVGPGALAKTQAVATARDGILIHGRGMLGQPD